jgi:hypothetical protein
MVISFPCQEVAGTRLSVGTMTRARHRGGYPFGSGRYGGNHSDVRHYGILERWGPVGIWGS